MPSTVNLAQALAAIEQRLTANWTDTKIAFENVDPDPADGQWPPVDANGVAQTWVYCELVDTGIQPGFGTPGDKVIVEYGLIKLYVMVQKGNGLADARAKAVALGEIFRDQEFFNSDPTARVRTTTPQVGSDPMAGEDGGWFAGASCTVPYEFWHQA